MADLHVTIEGHSLPDFDSRIFKVGLRKAANKVKVGAKRNLARRGVSKPGEFPGKREGVVQASITTRILKGGFTAVVEPKRTAALNERTSKKGKAFYPQILIKGSEKHHIKPRLDPVQAAFEANREDIRVMLTNALHDALHFKK